MPGFDIMRRTTLFLLAMVLAATVAFAGQTFTNKDLKSYRSAGVTDKETIEDNKEFWASAKSNRYHFPSCRYAKKIKKEYLIIFESPEEAIDALYVPCKVCLPPEK